MDKYAKAYGMKSSHETVQGLLTALFGAPVETRRMRLAAYLSNVDESVLLGVLALTRANGTNADFKSTLLKVKYFSHGRAHLIQQIVSQESIALRLMEGIERAVQSGIDLDEYFGIRKTLRRITHRFRKGLGADFD